MKDTQLILLIGAVLTYYIWTQSAKTTAVRKPGVGIGKGTGPVPVSTTVITGAGNAGGNGVANNYLLNAQAYSGGAS